MNFPRLQINLKFHVTELGTYGVRNRGIGPEGENIRLCAETQLETSEPQV